MPDEEDDYIKSDSGEKIPVSVIKEKLDRLLALPDGMIDEFFSDLGLGFSTQKEYLGGPKTLPDTKLKAFPLKRDLDELKKNKEESNAAEVLFSEWPMDEIEAGLKKVEEKFRDMKKLGARGSNHE